MSTHLACKRCGRAVVLPAFVAGFASFTCGACNHYNVMRGEAPADPRLSTVAQALGATVSGTCAIVPVRPYDVQISIEFSSGTPMGVSFHMRIPPQPEITFTIESSLDRKAKSIGLAREVQLGDASFDPHVWVDAELPDEVVLTMLRSPEARRAIVAILHCGHLQTNVIPAVDVKLREQGLFATVGLSILDDANALRAVLEAIVTLSRSITPVAPQHVGSPQTPRTLLTLIVIGIVLATAAIPSCVVGGLHAPIGGTLAPYLLGVSAGLGLWLATLPIPFFVLRGRSGAVGSMMIASALWLGALCSLGGALAPALNWTLDDSKVETHKAKIVSIEEKTGEDDGHWTELTVHCASCGDVTLKVAADDPTTAKVGKTVPIRIHRGYFGWPWRAP